jgi:hypothetical protein
MPIVASDIKIRLSGGAANSNVNLSLGGAKSTTEVVDNTAHNLFDQVTGSESGSGDTEYRCVYIHNNHASLTMQNVRVYIQSNSTSVDDTWEIALGSSAVNGTEQTIPDENTAPTGVTFSNTAVSYATGLAPPDIPFGQHKAIWYKRIVNPAAAAINNNSVTINVDCDTAA